MILAIHVDDILLVGAFLDNLKQAERLLHAEFDMASIGEAAWFLGVEIARSWKNKSIDISQKAYIERIISRFGMDDCHGIQVPMDSNTTLHPIQRNKKPANWKLFEQAISALLWLIVGTCPDICVVVGYRSQFNSNTIKQHWQAVKRVLRYLEQTSDYCLNYPAHVQQPNFKGYRDTSYPDNKTDERSTAGYSFILSGRAVS